MARFLLPFLMLLLAAPPALAQRRSGLPQLVGNPRDPKVYLWPTADPGEPFPILDSNAPMLWTKEGMFRMFASAGHAYWAEGTNIRTVTRVKSDWTPIRWTNETDGGRWMEAIIQGDKSDDPSNPEQAEKRIYGWYHREPTTRCLNLPRTERVNDNKTSPLIGAGYSDDGGQTWTDLGVIIAPLRDSIKCPKRGFTEDGQETWISDNANHYFNGGNGDESVILDQKREWLYIFYSSYAGREGRLEDQGVMVARMKWSDRMNPRGKVWKYNGAWSDAQPGVIDFDPIYGIEYGGYARPVFKAFSDWLDPEGKGGKAFWGASVHWNTYLQRYVILLNLSADQSFTPGGVYISYSSPNLEEVMWTEPYPIDVPTQWYPQVIGMPSEKGTDKFAGRWATLKVGQFIRGTLVFARPEETIACPPIEMEGYQWRCRN